MPVMMTGKVAGMTPEIYDGIATNLMPMLQKANGFISHAAGVGEDGVWTVIEVWDSQEQAQRWFEENVKPNLPAGITPDRRYRTLHNFTKA